MAESRFQGICSRPTMMAPLPTTQAVIAGAATVAARQLMPRRRARAVPGR